MRRVSARVLPDPAPARISSGPSPWVTACRWGSLRPSSRASAAVLVVTGSRIDPTPAGAATLPLVEVDLPVAVDLAERGVVAGGLATHGDAHLGGGLVAVHLDVLGLDVLDLADRLQVGGPYLLLAVVGLADLRGRDGVAERLLVLVLHRLLEGVQGLLDLVLFRRAACHQRGAAGQKDEWEQFPHRSAG